MQIFAFLSLISSIIILVLGIFVYSTNWRSQFNRIFLFLCVMAFYWAFMESMLRDANSISSAFVWMKLTAFWTFVPAATLHFTLYFTESKFLSRSSWISLLIYGPAALFSFIELSTNLIIATPVLRYWGYSYQYAPNMIPYLIELAWAFGIVVLSLFLCIWYYFHVPGLQQKNQTKYIVVGFSVAIIGEFVSEAVLPFFHIVIPEPETIFFIFFSGMVAYAVLKFELFVVNPTTAADNIVSTMTDALILLDHSNTIMSVNEETVKIVGYPQENLVGRPFSALFANLSDSNAILSKITGDGAIKDVETVFRSQDGVSIPISFSGSVIRNTSGENNGIVCISRDITQRKLLEDTLKENERRFRELADLLPQTIFEMDLAGNLTYVNYAGIEIFGIDDKKIQSCANVREYLIPSDIERMHRGLALVMGGAKSSGEVYTLKKLDGTLMSAIVYTGPILRNGAAIGFRGIVIDITDRVNLEKTLSETTEFLTGILQVSPVGIFRLDQSGHITYINEAFKKITGIPFETIRGRYWADILPEEERNRMLLAVGASVKEHRMIESEARFIHPDGKLYWLFGQVVPLFETDGQIKGWVGTIMDITERKTIEVELRESEEKFRSLAENTAALLFSLDINGIFTYVSPLINRYGFLVEDVVSHHFIDFVYPDDRKEVQANLRAVIDGESEITSVFRIVDKWGYIHWVEEILTIRVDVFGKPVGVYGVMRDVTDRRRTEDAMQLANKKLNLLNNITRHDIINTITGVLGCVDMAVSTENKEEHDILLTEIKDLVRVIQRQITFTREYQEVGVHAPVWQNLKNAMDQVLVNFSNQNILFELDLEVTEIYADPLLEKVFYNLIDNAIRYGETITTIRFYYQISDKGLALICEDDGVGIPAEAKEQIFERGIGRNTGMGLFLTREILMITGITIRENGTYGKGARFEILIPNGAWRFTMTGFER